MQTLKYGLLFICLFTFAAADAQPKFLKKVANATNKILNNAGTASTPSAPVDNEPAPNTNSRKPQNRGGQGLITTPPDVPANLSSAEEAFKKKGYGEARYALQQAMLGVELQIGAAILKSLPSEVDALPVVAASDAVASTGWGWAGLTIKREYRKDDKNFSVTVANNAVWMQAINLYLNSGGYSQSSGEKQNWKQTKLKNHRAVIEYEEREGYKLSVPLGQTTILLLEGVNFATEAAFMKAAETIDLVKIKALLNEK